jgi:hypothetical protein
VQAFLSQRADLAVSPGAFDSPSVTPGFVSSTIPGGKKVRKKSMLLALILVSLPGVTGVMTPASAAGTVICQLQASKGSTYTKVTNTNCSLVQAQLDKYINNVPTAYYGTLNARVSEATSTAGISAGHYFRGQYVGQMSDWVSF